MKADASARVHSLGALTPDEAYTAYKLACTRELPITGQRIHPSFIHALGHVKAASIEANHTIGHLPEELYKPLLQAAPEMAEGKWDDQIMVDPIKAARHPLNMNANEVIANRALSCSATRRQVHVVHPNARKHGPVHKRRHSNGIPHRFMERLGLTIKALLGLQEALRQKKPIRRHFESRPHPLQDAVPIRLGQEFAAYAGARRARRAAREGLHTVNMGATAVGTGLNADPAYIEHVVMYLRERTGYPLELADDLVDATQNIDPLVHASAALRTCAVNLTKIANDLRLMASGPIAGFGEIRLPARQPGSSIMPGKVNPVMAEVVNQVAFRIMGNDLTVTLVAQAGQLELNVMQPVAFHALLESADILANVLEVFTKYCVTGIEANAEATRAQAESIPGLATALNPYIGYDAATGIANEALATGRSIRELVLERELMDEALLDRVLQPEALTSPRSLDFTGEEVIA